MKKILAIVVLLIVLFFPALGIAGPLAGSPEGWLSLSTDSAGYSGCVPLLVRSG